MSKIPTIPQNTSFLYIFILFLISLFCLNFIIKDLSYIFKSFPNFFSLYFLLWQDIRP